MGKQKLPLPLMGWVIYSPIIASTAGDCPETRNQKNELLAFMEYNIHTLEEG